MIKESLFSSESPPAELTVKHVRAARALLAWSQQDLAGKADVAVSTVADFERGRRTPVANNASAIRSALERAGVRFLPGGAVVGPVPPSLAPSVKSGAPIRWVNVTDLSHWADRRDGQDSLPTLISNLVRAAHGPSVRLRFPSDEGVHQAGLDGMTDAEQASVYVPQGPTAWELSTQRENIAKKATADYTKRTKNSGEFALGRSTFIFVTLRHWAKKDEWAQQMRADGKWREVRAYDASDLVHWIELYPAVGQWLATTLGKRPADVRGLEEIWHEWSLATRCPLTSELVLADRDEDAAFILRWLREQASAMSLQGESAEEVAAFLHAAIEQLPETIAQHYKSRCLVATTSEGARDLVDSSTPLIVVLLDPEPGLAQRLSNRGHHVLQAYSGTSDPRGDVRRLSRPSREGIEQALQDAGVPNAESLARESSRSLAILRRLVPAAPGRLPDWAKRPPPRGLVAALLAGSWDEGVDADKTILARLAGETYEKVIADLVALASVLDGPVRKVGTAWKVASPQDAWILLAPYLAPTDVEKFEAAAIDVFGAADPRYEVDPDERWLSSVKGVEPQYSSYLRRGLGEVLILLALFGHRANCVSGTTALADRIVRTLLTDASAARWWSLSRDLTLLAEASPTAFLDAVDDSLQRDPPPILSLFGVDGGPFGGEHVADLLWALETLAWEPGNLTRVSYTLAKLDDLDPGGKYANRPGRSLINAFLLWRPQTHASLEQRLRVLDRLRVGSPDAAWKLMLGILPSSHGYVSPAPRPRWRDYTPKAQEVVTYGLIAQGAKEISERLLQEVGARTDRWRQLIDRITDLAPDPSAAIEKLSAVAATISDAEERAELWESIRDVLHRHREIPDADWALSERDLERIEQVYAVLEPADFVRRLAWLFAPSVNLPHPGSDGWRSNSASVPAERRRAARTLIDEHGPDGVFELAHKTQAPEILGASLCEIQIDPSLRDQVLEHSLRSVEEREREVARGMINSLFAEGKESWASELLARAMREDWGVDALLAILGSLPATRWTWEQAQQAGVDVEALYWKRTDILRWIDGDAQDVVYAVQKLIDAGRARHAVHLAGHHLAKGLPADLLIAALDQAVAQPWDANEGGNAVTMFRHYVGEILQVLDKASAPDDVLLRLEWAYLPLLEHSRRRPVKVLSRALAEQPKFFVDVLCAIFKPRAESGIVEPPPDDPERARAVASKAFDLLSSWYVVPGTTEAGIIDARKLEGWIKEVRSLAQELGRAEIADQYIGQALSASPVDADGIWPAVAVREVIERARSKNIETGIDMGVHNRRGVTSRGLREGGEQERALAEKYRAYSRATVLEWPRTSAVLERIAQGYEQDARWHDETAERIDWE